LLLLLFFAFYQFSLPLKTYARMLFLLFQQALLKGSLSPEHILFAAEDCTVPSDRISSIYADLWAVATCSAKSFFPWADCLDSYPFPEHLEGLVNRVTGEIDRAELERRIEELKPHANL
jgi:hypothetical protein